MRKQIHANKAKPKPLSMIAANYRPSPICVDDVRLPSSLLDLTEVIAENVHDNWARARMDQGWTYGNVRDDAKKQHPDLIPYLFLPESEKEYDRQIALNTIRLILKLGYSIQLMTHTSIIREKNDSTPINNS